MYYSLYINNKNGSLIYQRDFSDIPLTANDRIRLASTFHGLCTIARQISPIKTKRSDEYIQNSNGISSISAELFRLECFETLTGLRFFLIASKDAQGLNELLHKVYQGYTDYVLKNPFHDLDMPIRSILFDKEIDRIFSN
ncbi:sybindin-like family [Cryptosporidium sp. chipmunk genotype I]|uniref:sybindin-like family n=1 Tax=Cryptosporidium sp. chipmunk genotype I TaxID=1280935 RepID=UPI00351A2525|nr:sybindin-like family [Cryptosporidium sp. chipmunk genotype I]